MSPGRGWSHPNWWHYDSAFGHVHSIDGAELKSTEDITSCPLLSCRRTPSPPLIKYRDDRVFRTGVLEDVLGYGFVPGEFSQSFFFFLADSEIFNLIDFPDFVRDLIFSKNNVQ